MNKIIYTLITFITFSCISFSANAAYIRGMTSCGKWTSDKQDMTIRHGQRMWLLGYLSGVSDIVDTDVLKNTDVESIALWMDNYCQTNPLKDTSDGAAKLFKELQTKK